MAPGDRIRSTCGYDTRGQDVRYGEASQDEVCFNVIYPYAQINFQFARVSYRP